MKHLADDPSLDPENVTKEDLEQKGLSPDTINIIMEAKKLYDKCKPENLDDIDKILDDLDKLYAEIEANTQKLKAVGDKLDNLDDEIGSKEEASKKADMLTKALPDEGETSPKQSKLVDDTVIDLMKDLLNDPSIDPDTVTKED